MSIEFVKFLVKGVFSIGIIIVGFGEMMILKLGKDVGNVECNK